MGAGVSAALSGYTKDDLHLAVRALETWQLCTHNRCTVDEAMVLLDEQETKQKEGNFGQDDSLLARLGGRNTVRWVFSAFYKRIMGDERLNFFFDGVSMDAHTGMPAKNSAFMCHILGNAAAFDRNYRGMTPHQYSGACGLLGVKRKTK